MVSDSLFASQRGRRRVSIRFEVRGGFRRTLKSCPLESPFQSALRFAVVSDQDKWYLAPVAIVFQSALRFAVVSDLFWIAKGTIRYLVSIRFEVRGGFRLPVLGQEPPRRGLFQSALRFAVVSDKRDNY